MVKKKQEAVKTSRPVGKPPFYKPEYCEKVIELMSEGMSRVEVAAEFGLAGPDTLKDWENNYPEFLQAIKEATNKSNAWWEKHGRQNIHNKEFNTKLWQINMQNRFKWCERQESESKVTISHEELLKELK